MAFFILVLRIDHLTNSFVNAMKCILSFFQPFFIKLVKCFIQFILWPLWQLSRNIYRSRTPSKLRWLLSFLLQVAPRFRQHFIQTFNLLIQIIFTFLQLLNFLILSSNQCLNHILFLLQRCFPFILFIFLLFHLNQLAFQVFFFFIFGCQKRFILFDKYAIKTFN